jgi:hypothetical protein
MDYTSQSHNSNLQILASIGCALDGAAGKEKIVECHTLK